MGKEDLLQLMMVYEDLTTKVSLTQQKPSELADLREQQERILQDHSGVMLHIIKSFTKLSGCSNHSVKRIKRKNR